MSSSKKKTRHGRAALAKHHRGQKRWRTSAVPAQQQPQHAGLGIPEKLNVDPEIDWGHRLYKTLKEMSAEERKAYAEKFMHHGFRVKRGYEQIKDIHVIDSLDDMKEAGDRVYLGMLDKVRGLAPLAKRFVFDDEASEHLGLFIRDNPETLIDARQFALPPYENTYIQLNIDKTLQAIGSSTTADRPGWDGSKDLETAYLVHQKMIYPMARGNLHNTRLFRGGLSLFSYELRNGKTEGCGCRPIFFDEPLLDTDDRDHTARAMLLLGSTVNGLKPERYLPFLHDVRIHVNLEYDKYRGLPAKQRYSKRWDLITSSAGDFRVILAALILLNQQRHIQTVYVPNNSMLIKGKRRVVRQHHRVVIQLTALQQIRRSLGHTLATPRVEHEVRGHWRNVRTLKGCTHDWQNLSDPGEGGHVRWACTRCNGLRTTVTPHKRGNAEIGTTTKSYEVKE